MTSTLIISVLLLIVHRSLSAAAAAPAPAVPTPTTNPAIPPFAQLATTASPTSCRLQLEGYGSKPGLKSASLECTGAALNAGAAASLLAALGPQARSIKWSCSSDPKCLLSICSSAVTFRAPVIQDVLVTDPGITALVCIGDNSSVILQNGAFSNWHSQEAGTFVAVNVTSSSASLVVSNTTFMRDAQPRGAALDAPFGGALMAVAGQTTVLSSSFVGGAAEQGGAIVASGQAQVDIGPGPTGESLHASWPGLSCKKLGCHPCTVLHMRTCRAHCLLGIPRLWLFSDRHCSAGDASSEAAAPLSVLLQVLPRPSGATLPSTWAGTCL